MNGANLRRRLQDYGVRIAAAAAFGMCLGASVPVTAQVVRPLPVPGRIEAENYDLGGPDVSYYDDGPGNAGNVYRSDDVDLEPTTDVGGGYNVGWTGPGEWLNYTLNVQQTGIYEFTFRAASAAGAGTILVFVDELPYCTVATPATGAWQNWQTVAVSNLMLQAGTRLLRLQFQTGGCNLNYFQIIKQASPTGAFLKASGKQIVNGEGQNVLLRGMGIGNWMLQEPYMMDVSGIVDNQQQLKSKISELVGTNNMAAFYTAWLSNYFRVTDVAKLSEAGFNSIRLPMHYGLFTLPVELEPVPGANTWLPTGFQIVDTLLSWCESNHIYLILDMHACPGGQGHDRAISDYNPLQPSLWESSTNRAKLTALWRQLALRYSNREWIGAYDLINEPNWTFENPYDLNGCSDEGNVPLRQLLIELTTAIRQVDTNHLIIVEGNCWGSNYRGIFPPWDSNLAISFHKYWDQPTAASLQGWTALRDQWNMPLWLGESGENSNEWFREVVRFAEQANIGWSWWPWKKLNSAAGTLTVNEPASYQAILNYWRNSGPKPSTNAAVTGLLQLAEAARFENCVAHPDVFDALLRPDTQGVTLPFKPHVIPGKIFAADYDLGAPGQAFFDTTTNNPYNTGWAYRNESVDVEPCNDSIPLFGYDVGWLDPGDWMKYTTTPLIPGPYAVSARVASGGVGGSFYLEVGGSNVTGVINVPPTGSWQSWITLPAVGFTTAQPMIGFKFIMSSGEFNLNWLRFDSLMVPTLSAKYSPEGFSLSWFITLSNYTLYSSTNVSSPVFWTPVTNAIVTGNGTCTVTVAPSSSNRFFRLQK